MKVVQAEPILSIDRASCLKEIFRANYFLQMQTSAFIFVARGKGGKSRIVPVIPGHEQYVQICIEGQDNSNELVFSRLPSHLDIYTIRRTDAQRLYRYLSNRELPPSEGHIQSSCCHTDLSSIRTWREAD